MSGRGRGWLNLNKNNKISTPGIVGGLKHEGGCDPVEFSDAEINYPDLVHKIKELELNTNEHSQSLITVGKIWDNIVRTEDEELKCITLLVELALNDSDFASKLIATSTIVVQQYLYSFRRSFFTCLQQTYENLVNEDTLDTNNMGKFRKFVPLLGEFCIKKELTLVPVNRAFINCLKVLVKSADVVDIKLFATQVMSFGPIVVIKKPQIQFSTEFLTIVRRQLLSDHLTKESRLWLLLALDLFNHQFGQLPVELKKFYQEQLGELPLTPYQNPYVALSVETTHSSKTLDNYQSQVNVLQVSTTQLEHDLNQVDLSDHKPTGRRPILGAGARFKNNAKPQTDELHQHKTNQEFFSNKNRNNENAMKPKARHSHNKSGGGGFGQSRNGWEHDDRFETDYS